MFERIHLRAREYHTEKNVTWADTWKKESIEWLTMQASKCTERIGHVLKYVETLANEEMARKKMMKAIEKAVDGINYLTFVVARIMNEEHIDVEDCLRDS